MTHTVAWITEIDFDRGKYSWRNMWIEIPADKLTLSIRKHPCICKTESA